MKKELRKKFIKERNTLPEEYRIEASNKIFSLLEELDLFNKAERIFVFVGFGSEITTEIFIKKHLANKQIYVPKIVNGDMKLVNITRWDSLKPGHFNVLEPESDDFYNGSYDQLLQDNIPTEEHDQKVDFIITEKGIITC